MPTARAEIHSIAPAIARGAVSPVCALPFPGSAVSAGFVVSAGVEVSVFLRETEDGIYKVSLRSNEYVNVSDVCLMFGGGGHVRAAGCMIDKPLEHAKERIINVLKKLGLPTKAEFDKDDIINTIKHDKKATGDKITVIYVKEIGSFEMRKIDISELYGYINEV